MRKETFTNRVIEVCKLMKLSVETFEKYMSSILFALNKFTEFHLAKLSPQQILTNHDFAKERLFNAATKKLERIDENCPVKTER